MTAKQALPAGVVGRAVDRIEQPHRRGLAERREDVGIGFRPLLADDGAAGRERPQQLAQAALGLGVGDGDEVARVTLLRDLGRRRDCGSAA